MHSMSRTYLQHPWMRVSLTLVSVLAILSGVMLVGALPETADASNMNVLRNGSFEGGFYSAPGCGMVGTGWDCFTNGGAAAYGFYDDEWEPVVADGSHSQLIEVNTKGLMAGDVDRYAGIAQTVQVQPWAKYKLHVRGMIRTTNPEGDPWRYQVQIGWTSGKGSNWQQVANWQDAGWYEYYNRTEPGNFSDYSSILTARDEYITVYIRVWKKWGVPNEEIDVNLDAISLTGVMPEMGKMGGGMMEGGMAGEGPMMTGPAMGKMEEPMMPEPTMGQRPEMWRPEKPMSEPMGMPLSCSDENLVYNGNFEHGFNPATIGHVGRGWGSFTNGGAAEYGFYDEMWEPVVADGEHGQLIEINTHGIVPAQGDRYAGIYQKIGQLEVGKSYELVVRGMMRGDGGEEGDPNRFEAQVGYNWGYDTEWQHVSNWSGMDLGGIYPRTEPGAIGTYRVRFKAEAPVMVLFLQGWFKWGESNLEMNLNYDAISLKGCAEQPMMKAEPPMNWQPERPMMEAPMMPEKPMSWQPQQPMAEKPMMEQPMMQEPMGESCIYVVKPGDMLGSIAGHYGVSVADLMKASRIDNPDLIYIGQKLKVPNCGMAEQMPEPMAEKPMAQEPMMPEPMKPEQPMAEKPMMQEPMAQEPMMKPAETTGQRPSMWRPEKEPMGHSEMRIHKVRAGETLSAICAAYGVDAREVARLNGIANVNFIYVGQELMLP